MKKFLRIKSIILFVFIFFGFFTNAQVTTIGSGTTTQIYPLGNYYGFERSAAIYTAAEVGATGNLTKIGWYCNTAGASRPIKIYLKTTAAANFPANTTWATQIAGATLVYDGPAILAVGWNTFAFSSAFNYTGNNLQVMVEANYGGSGTGGSTGTEVRYSTAANTHQWWRADNSAPTGNGTRNGQRPNIQINRPAPYEAQYVSMNTGASTWCAGETRNVSVTIKNIGTLAWADGGGEDFNIGIKWNAEPDYMVRVDAGNLASGASQTFNFSVTAPAAGANNLTFNVVREGIAWFGGAYVSPAITINPLPTGFSTGSNVSSCGGNIVLNGSSTNITTTFLSDDFESYSNFNVSGSSSPWRRSGSGDWDVWNHTGSAATGSRGMATFCGGTEVSYCGSVNSIAYNTTLINSSSAIFTNITLTFNWKGNGEFWSGNWVDYGNVTYSTDGGVTWIDLPFLYNSQATFASQTVDLTFLSGQSFLIGFRWRSDGGTTNAPGFAIDDVLIVGEKNNTLSWSGGPIISGGLTPTPTVNPTSTTTYTLTATSNGCSASDNVIVNVISPAGNPATFGNNQWNVYAYNGNSTTLSNNTYRGYYTQPNLTGENLGISTQDFWSNINSPSYAGTTIDNGNLWNGCNVDEDVHTIVHKRKGFPCGNYTFTMNNWDDETRVIVNGVNLWSCGVWSGAPASYINSNGSTYSCLGTTSLTVSLDANSEIEIQTYESTGGSNIGLDLFLVSPNTLSNTSTSSRTCAVNGTTWINFFDVDNNLIASVNPHGNNLGNVQIDSYLGAPQVMQDCSAPTNPAYHTAYMGRTWIMNSSAYPAGVNFPSNVSVRLPFNDSELAALNNHAVSTTTGNPNDNGAALPNLMLTKITGATENGIANSADCASTIRGISSNSGSGTNIQSIANTQYVDFSIGQFSEFFLHKNINNSPLPVKLTNFSATCDKVVTLSWTTASEQNSDRFVIEKSRDGQEWRIAEEQPAAGTSNTIINYTQTDEYNWNGVTYYRLRQIDFNGEEAIYGPISTSCATNQSNMTVYPNPNNGSFTIEIASDEMHNNASIILTDMTGKVISTQKANVVVGTTQILIDGLELQKGTYLVTLQDADAQLKPVKVLVK